MIGVMSAILGVDSDTFQQAAFYRSEYGLEHIDSLIYASVIADLKKGSIPGPSCFISTDKRGFALPEINAEVSGYGSRYISTVTNGLDFIRGELKQSSSISGDEGAPSQP